MTGWTAALLVVAAVFSLAGCSAGRVAQLRDSYAEYDSLVAAQEFDRAVEKVRENRHKGLYRDKDAFLAHFDLGMAYLYAGQTDSAVTYLRKSEDFAEANYRKALDDFVSGAIGSEVNMTYGGEDHEVLYTTVMKSLAFASEGRLEEALVEARRTDSFSRMLQNAHLDFQEQYEQKLAVRADSLATSRTELLEEFPVVDSWFGHYLSAHLYRAQGQMDDARIDLDRLPPRLVRGAVEDPGVEGVVDLGDGRPVLSVVGLFGASPYKDVDTYRFATFPGEEFALILKVGVDSRDDALASVPWPFDTQIYAKFEIPKLLSPTPLVQSAELRIDGEVVGHLQMLEDVGELGRATFERKKAAIYLRTLVRSTLKAFVLAKTAEEVKKKTNGSLLGVLVDLTSAAVTEFTEAADIRSARFLPAQVWCLDVPIEPGIYDLEVVLRGPGGQVVGRDLFEDMTIEARQPWVVLPVFDARRKGTRIGSPISWAWPPAAASGAAREIADLPPADSSVAAVAPVAFLELVGAVAADADRVLGEPALP